MIAIGLVLLVLAVLAGTGVVLANDQPVSGSAFGVSLDDVSLGTVFLLGAAVGAVALVGLALMLAGARRQRARARAVQAEVEGVRGQSETLAEHNARLQAELASRRAAAEGWGALSGSDEASGGRVLDLDSASLGAPVKVSSTPVSTGRSGSTPIASATSQTQSASSTSALPAVRTENAGGSDASVAPAAASDEPTSWRAQERSGTTDEVPSSSSSAAA